MPIPTTHADAVLSEMRDLVHDTHQRAEYGLPEVPEDRRRFAQLARALADYMDAGHAWPTWPPALPVRQRNL